MVCDSKKSWIVYMHANLPSETDTFYLLFFPGAGMWAGWAVGGGGESSQT